jgi:ABC-type transporter Mla subunit MlaD
MRRIALILGLFACAAFAFAAPISADEEIHTYKLEMFNAFGLVEGSEVKVAGVNAGTVESLSISEDKTALVEVKLTGPLAVLGVDTECSSEPQSLIAEYFIDCQPAGEPAEDGSTLKNKVAQTVQPDLVQNALREPFKDRLAILINEFGTALAGNPENLNEAIRLGAPALEDLHDALKLLAKQNTVIRDLNVDSDRIVGVLAERRDDVSAFIRNAGVAAAASAERSDDLSRNFDRLDDFLAELEPTMVELGNTARETTPLLGDLRAAAPQLTELSESLPPFNRVAEDSLVSLGRASVVGENALRRGIQRGTFDIDDPRRIVEIDDRAAKTCDNDQAPCFSTGREGPTGYTGLEGVLNYAYYQAGSTNQYDSAGHLLHFTLYDVFTGPCGRGFNAQQEWPRRSDIEPPAADGTGTTNIQEAANCVGVLGENQPGITESEESICAQAPADQICSPFYDPAVCQEPNAAGVDAQDVEFFEDPSQCSAIVRRAQASAEEPVEAKDRQVEPAQSDDSSSDPPEDVLPDVPDLPVDPDDTVDDVRDIIDNLPGDLGKAVKGVGKGKMGKRRIANAVPADSAVAANDLLDFLFVP